MARHTRGGPTARREPARHLVAPRPPGLRHVALRGPGRTGGAHSRVVKDMDTIVTAAFRVAAPALLSPRCIADCVAVPLVVRRARR